LKGVKKSFIQRPQKFNRYGDVRNNDSSMHKRINMNKLSFVPVLLLSVDTDPLDSRVLDTGAEEGVVGAKETTLYFKNK
jgi:hypothetical protein